MSRILDEGSIWFAVACVLLISFALQGLSGQPAFQMHRNMPVYDENGEVIPPQRADWSDPAKAAANLLSSAPFGAFTALFLLTVAFVPCCILGVHLVDRRSGLGQKMYADFTPLLICVLCAWTAASLPVLAVRALLPALAMPAKAASLFYFGFLMLFALRSVFGMPYGSAAAATLIGALGPILGLAGYDVVGTAISWLASPFFLFWGYRFFQGDLHALGSGLRSRQAFRRHLEFATINPNDAEAHYQLGLIYVQRRRVTEAASHFERAAKIDKTEAGPLFQLGLIARDAGRKQDALAYFASAAKLEPGHSASEVLREWGAALKAAGRPSEALPILEQYRNKRPYDPAGLFHTGETCEQLNQPAAAQEAYRTCIEAVQTAPHFRRGNLRQWRRLAETRLKALDSRVKIASA